LTTSVNHSLSTPGSEAHAAFHLEAVALSYAAQVSFWRGRVAEAVSRVERFLPLARQIGDPQVLTPSLVIASIVHEAEGDVAASKALVEEVADTVEKSEFSFFNFFHLTDVARICAQGETSTWSSGCSASWCRRP
jgi:ATP/maltotriose-dependent transcriptional regulator MalT